ncbi:phage head closure protein [Cytobacillus firmus]|uniref:phage head closure protein n=1 Tax=Cytobacillus firmus TaxID=1399 RepID=UPI0036746461
MNPAQFRHRITFQSGGAAVDSDGFPIPEKDAPFIDVVTVWAMNKTVSGREYVQAAATQNERVVRWVIRHRTGLSEDMRVLFEGRIFEIEAILSDDELKKTLTIVCKEVM